MAKLKIAFAKQEVNIRHTAAGWVIVNSLAEPSAFERNDWDAGTGQRSEELGELALAPDGK